MWIKTKWNWLSWFLPLRFVCYKLLSNLSSTIQSLPKKTIIAKNLYPKNMVLHLLMKTGHLIRHNHLILHKSEKQRNLYQFDLIWLDVVIMHWYVLTFVIKCSPCTIITEPYLLISIIMKNFELRQTENMQFTDLLWFKLPIYIVFSDFISDGKVPIEILFQSLLKTVSEQ